MKYHTLALTLIIATGIAATSAVLAYSPAAPAAVRINEGASRPATLQPNVDPVLLRDGSADACRDSLWPYLPAACIRNAPPERMANPVRIIPIHALPQAN
jgi:hypothetical protein